MISTRLQSIVKAVMSPRHWLSFILGLSLVFAYAPFGHWWLPFVILPVFLSLIEGQSPRNAAWLSFSFGTGWFASGISWVHVSIDQFGGMPLVASLGLMLLLCLYLALFPALAAYLAAHFSARKALAVTLFIPSWIFTEWLRGWVFTGFPWLSLGYTQIDSPLRALAPVIGEIGLGFILLWLAAATLFLFQKRHLVPATLCIVVVITLTILSTQLTWVTPNGQTKKVALVQGNIAQSIKWQPEQELPTMLKYLDLTRQNYDAELVVWPESAIPTLEPLAGEYLDMVNQAAAMNDTAIITGILNYNVESKESFNGLIVLGKKQQDDTEGSYYYPSNNRFYKHHLLPIGEFVPFEDLLRPLAPFFNLPMSSFTRGDYVQNNLQAHSLHIAPLICFEIAFPNQLAANFYDKTDLLLTVSNDAWFGDSHGPHQHMDIARMRALEFGRPLVRSTNTGITAIVDQSGQYIARLPQFEEGVLKADIELVEGFTPFSRWQGYPIYLTALLFFIVQLIRTKERFGA